MVILINWKKFAEPLCYFTHVVRVLIKVKRFQQESGAPSWLFLPFLACIYYITFNFIRIANKKLSKWKCFHVFSYVDHQLWSIFMEINYS
jgi:uncharacterized membrane protein SirB2